MRSLRDRWHESNSRDVLRHPADRWRYSAASARFWNWRGQKARERGRRDIPARIGDQVRSRMPVVRSRINRGTGRPHRDDAWFGRMTDQSLARQAINRQVRGIWNPDERVPPATARQMARWKRLDPVPPVRRRSR